ncbi:MAG TPA: DUF1697 domain-containing protein [Thermoanaerobaculia bacterium]|nr:DUF1697 domain-containing protein [Thermoanaerobaculia bacterium]
MTTYVAFLRGINVVGRNVVRMSELRDLCTSLGWEDVRTLLNSGNVVFRAQKATPKALEEALGGVRVILRTEGELRKVAENNPFDPVRNPSYLHVAFCDKKVSADTLRDAYGDKGPEVIRGGGGRELYIDYVNGVGRSKLSHAYIERTLGATATLRNWNTVTKLLAMASQ